MGILKTKEPVTPDKEEGIATDSNIEEDTDQNDDTTESRISDKSRTEEGNSI